MSYYKGSMVDQIANMRLDSSLSNLIESEDYVKLCIYIIKDLPENLKSNVKKIMNKFYTKDKIVKLLSALISCLNNDLTLWECDNTIKMFFNELETESVNLMAKECDRIKAQKLYDVMMENQFEVMFENIKRYLDKVLNASILDSSFFHMNVAIISFTKLVDIRGYEAVLYPMTCFAELLLTKFICFDILQPITMEFIAHINHRLINYLAVTPGNPVAKGLREAINIYEIIRNSLINMVFVQPEVISNAIHCLEVRARFFGVNADAIPENENHGSYIVIDPLNTPFEDDDVYEDYEKFLATLPN